MKMYVLFLSEGEYVESYDLANKEVSLIDDKYNAEHFSKWEARYLADRLACDFEEIEVED